MLLIDSEAAIKRLTWFKRKDFRPIMSKVKDRDIIEDIVKRIHKRETHNLSTTMVKVHGHSGEPLHQLADELATQGADRELQKGERPIFALPDATNLTFEFKDQSTKGTTRGQWSPKVKRQIRQHEAEEKWRRHKANTWADHFHQATNAGRQMLGQALQRTWDWAVKGWIESITPNSYPVAQTFHTWNPHISAKCKCGNGNETTHHLQLWCGLPERQLARQKAHDNMMKVLEHGIEEHLGEHRRAIWNAPAGSLLSLAPAVDNIGLIRKWKWGKPAMDDVEPRTPKAQEMRPDWAWHKVMRAIWAKQAQRRADKRKTTGQGSAMRTGKSSTEQTSISGTEEMNAVRSRHEAQGRKRDRSTEGVQWDNRSGPGDTSKKRKQARPKWANADDEDEVCNRKPDGIIVDDKNQIIFIVEGARTSDSAGSLHDVDARKHHHYRPLRQKLRATYPDHQVCQLNFVMGIRGTIDERQWLRNLEILGIPDHKATRIIQRCMIASIEGMQLVLATKWESET